MGRSLFKGYWATNGVWLPWNMIYVAGYLEAKRLACAALGHETPEQLPAWAVAGCSAGAAAGAALATHPADVVKTRLQVGKWSTTPCMHSPHPPAPSSCPPPLLQPPAPPPLPLTQINPQYHHRTVSSACSQVLSATTEGARLNALGIARDMWAREGSGAFWRGLSARVLNIAPGCALSWALYENIKGWLDERHRTAAAATAVT